MASARDRLGRWRGLARRAALELQEARLEQDQVQLVHLEAGADRGEQGERQLAPEVLAKLLEPLQDGAPAQSSTELERRVPDRQPELFEQAQHPGSLRRAQVAGPHRVEGVQRDADRHRLAVAELEIGQALELVRRPVTEIERACRPELE